MLALCIFLSWFRWDYFFSGESILWIENMYLIWKQHFEVKNILRIVLFNTNRQLFTSQDINWWTGVVWITYYCDVFNQLFELSFWRHPFTAEDPLIHFSKSVPINKLTQLILDGLCLSKFSANFHFWVNYSFQFVNTYKKNIYSNALTLKVYRARHSGIFPYCY